MSLIQRFVGVSVLVECLSCVCVACVRECCVCVSVLVACVSVCVRVCVCV
jgi:hypothetical protein